jgi:hypothetical protein
MVIPAFLFLALAHQHSRATMLKRNKGKASFCEQKEAKKRLFIWAVLVSPPPAQTNKSFCAAFFKKRLLSFYWSP